MELEFATEKVKLQCKSEKEAKKLFGKDLEGYFAIDVKSIREPWRIILQPLNMDKQPYIPCNIDEIAVSVKIIEIVEVSKHYE